MKNDINIIGAGVAGMAAAAYLAKEGYAVSVFEKNSGPGGRINIWETDGFRFDMGPSWYWMPEVFEDFFQSMGSSVAEHYKLERLDPGYRVFFGEDEIVDIPADWVSVLALFENLEKGSASGLEKYMKEAAYKYNVGMNEFVWKPGRSIAEFADWKVLRSALSLDMFTSVSKHVSKYFKDPRLRQIMEFPVLFLGAAPDETPALYSLMNYADLKLGTWYPKGGMYEIAKAMERVAIHHGVKFHYNTEIADIRINNDNVEGLATVNGEIWNCDALIGAADYHHIDQHLLPEGYRQYSPSYWDKRSLAPSSLLFYIGLDRTIPNLQHHNLFFDEDFNGHAKAIYKSKEWPDHPLFYACCPSKTDPTVAPPGCENLFLLVPLAPGLHDTEEKREQLYEFMLEKIRIYTGISIQDHIKVKRSFALKEFKEKYHAFKGNAYGLANTLKQTALLKPAMHHKKLKNLLFAGQLTVPGPGLPPSIISGQLAGKEMHKKISQKKIQRI